MSPKAMKILIQLTHLRYSTGSTRLTGLILALSPFPEGRKKTQSACLPCGIGGYSTGAAENSSFIVGSTSCSMLPMGFHCSLRILASLEEGLRFLPFFRKGKKYV